LLRIENNGKEIIDTNYWESELNRGNKYIVSINSGAFRLLVPDAFLGEMKKELPLAKRIIITRKENYFDILLDDGSKYPYSFQFSYNSFDRLPSKGDSGKEFIFSAWTHAKGRPHKFFEKSCHYESEVVR